MAKRKLNVLILGGGPCGLTAAFALCKDENLSVTVLEKEHIPGGLCRTVSKDGYRFDLGGHRFISPDAELVKDVQDLLGPALLTVKRKSAIYYKNKLFEYPLRFDNILSNFDFVENCRILFSYLKTRVLPQGPGAITTLQQWLQSAFGKRLTDHFFSPYSEKLWGVPSSQLSADWADQRITIPNLGDAILRMLKLRHDAPATHARRFHYPTKGIGQIFTRMTEEIEKAGGQVFYDACPTQITMDKNDVREVQYLCGEKEQSVHPDYVISTIPLPDLAGLFPESIRTPLSPHTEKLNFRGLRFLNLFVDQPDFSDRTWTYVSDPASIFSRIQEPKRRSPASAPDGKTSLMLEIPCDLGDAIWQMPDAQLADLTLGQMSAMGLPIADKVTGCFSVHAQHAYPIYRLDYQQHRQTLLDRFNAIPNFITCGRQGGFSYLFMDAAMVMGRQAAQIAQKALAGEQTESAKKALLEMGRRRGLIEIQSTTAK